MAPIPRTSVPILQQALLTKVARPPPRQINPLTRHFRVYNSTSLSLASSSSRLADETALATAHATGTGPLPASRMCLPGCQQRLLKPNAAPGRHARKIVAATSCFFADGVAWNAVGHSSREHESRALCVGSSSAHLRFLWPIERHYSGVLFFSIVGQCHVHIPPQSDGADCRLSLSCPGVYASGWPPQRSSASTAPNATTRSSTSPTLPLTSTSDEPTASWRFYFTLTKTPTRRRQRHSRRWHWQCTTWATWSGGARTTRPCPKKLMWHLTGSTPSGP